MGTHFIFPINLQSFYLYNMICLTIFFNPCVQSSIFLLHHNLISKILNFLQTLPELWMSDRLDITEIRVSKFIRNLGVGRLGPLDLIVSHFKYIKITAFMYFYQVNSIRHKQIGIKHHHFLLFSQSPIPSSMSESTKLAIDRASSLSLEDTCFFLFFFFFFDFFEAFGF